MKNTFIIILLVVISTTLKAQIERPKWELGGGVRLNYMGLNGGFSGYRNDDGKTFDLNYEDIGMNTYSPSFAIAFGGRYKKLNLEFAGSKGSYNGSFITPADMVKDDVLIDSGSVVSGTVDMSMYALFTNFALIQKKHDLGVGIGFMLLNMGANYTTLNDNNEEVKLGGDQWFPMPFLAISGRLNFNKFRINISGGGAIFKGEMDDVDYDVKYYTVDVSVAYDFLKTGRLAYSADIGYRDLYMDLKMDNVMGWYKEKDIYRGPYATIRVKFSSEEMWKYIKRKDRNKTSNN
jgi:hypothetical protein